EGHSSPYPLGDYPAQSKPYTFARMPAAMVDPSALANANMVVLNGICDSSHYLAPAQGKMLVDYVFAGHKLAIYNADMCGEVTAYDFLPYQFVTSNPGASGAHGDRLIEVESDDLGSLDKTDTKRFLDAPAYAANESNQIGDANTVTTKDEHWCGHLFGTNAKKVNGFMQMYAPYGKGAFIFGGFDEDDNGVPSYERMRDLEFGLTLPADLPCSVKVDMSFVLEPDREATFVAGKAATAPFAMEVLANQGWKGHVNVTTAGQFGATVTPSSFDMDGGTQALALSVAIPATTKPGTYAVTVTGTDGAGKTSQAVIQFNGEAPLKKIPKKQKRIRLYGIHFDYNSAKIQPRSEPVIKEIADLMKGDKTLRFQVEGHTDSDGGAPYNMKLSQARAQSVVTDLIHHYHIAASRLVPKGFGLTKPVASNDTAGGKALNRRVELLRL
ncbi:MAG: OmpA family protein, partial [Candidatus Eremiobacteraeota bacterium]|nr:OmpA family protein [Candidatus Eremiobacteraeota bacterium]